MGTLGTVSLRMTKNATTKKHIGPPYRPVLTVVQRIWSLLHPDQPINRIILVPTDDTERAVDIGLHFYGKEQPSPRLTLSEGYRNSLGLAIFFAIALRGQIENHPLLVHLF